MRLVAAAVVAAAALAGAAGVPAGAGAPAPTLRVGTQQALTVVGAGFRARVLVRIRVLGPALDRRVAVRAGHRGGFVVRFAGIGRCTPTEVRATATNGERARVPPTWFVRECPPPPPLQPGTPVAR